MRRTDFVTSQDGTTASNADGPVLKKVLTSGWSVSSGFGRQRPALPPRRTDLVVQACEWQPSNAIAAIDGAGFGLDDRDPLSLAEQMQLAGIGARQQCDRR